MSDLTHLHEKLLADLTSYADSRKHDVARGAETPELAALLVQKYGYGLAKAGQLAAELIDHPAPSLIVAVDKLVGEIDPNWRSTQVRRFESRSASLGLTV